MKSRLNRLVRRDHDEFTLPLEGRKSSGREWLSSEVLGKRSFFRMLLMRAACSSYLAEIFQEKGSFSCEYVQSFAMPCEIPF
jgi:hypothetical protein